MKNKNYMTDDKTIMADESDKSVSFKAKVFFRFRDFKKKMNREKDFYVTNSYALSVLLDNSEKEKE